MTDGVEGCIEVKASENVEVATISREEKVVSDLRRAVSVLCWELNAN